MKNIFELTAKELSGIKVSILNKMIENEPVENSMERNSRLYKIYHKLNNLNELYYDFKDDEKQYLKDNYEVVFIENTGNTIGERVKSVRNSLKMNQINFGKELGISQPHVSGIEIDREFPSLTLVKFISLKYGINEQWLLNGGTRK